MKTKKKTGADNLFEALKDDPKAIIKWCEHEIKEYKKLIKLIKKETNEKNKSKT